MEKMLENSSFVQRILIIAEEIKTETGNRVMSVNHLFAAFLKFFNENSTEAASKEFNKKEIESVYEMVSKIATCDNFKECLDVLKSAPTSYLDDIQYKKLVKKSQLLSSKLGYDDVPGDIILSCIFSDVTEEIKKVAEMSKQGIKVSEQQIEPVDSAKVHEDEKGTAVSEKIDAMKKRFQQNQSGEEPDGEPEGEPVIKDEAQLSPKERIAAITEKAKLMQKCLSEVIFGQDNAISIFSSGYFQSELRGITDKNNRKPKASFLFAGPPGVGKTFLAETAAKFLEIPVKRFDMSEYSEPDAVRELCGSNAVYSGSSSGELTDFVRRYPECVLIFDEIEKADIRVIHLFLQVLDAGRLRDTKNKAEIDFSKATIIFTTNAGRKVYEDSETANLSSIPRKTILKALEKDVDPKTGRGAFPAAICSRFATGNVVMFNHMEAHVLHKIAEKEIQKNAEALYSETGIKCNIPDDIYSSILFAEGGHADARTIKSRAGAFFSTELYELFRLVSSPDNSYEIGNIGEINFCMESFSDEKLKELFVKKESADILVFASKNINSIIRKLSVKAKFKFAKTFGEAKKLIAKNEYDLILCDFNMGRKDEEENLNIEDIESDGRELFKYVCGETDIPLYVVYDKPDTYNEEELFSLLKNGARGGIDTSDAEALAENIDDILKNIHQQASMNYLARSNKIMSYSTSQTLSDDNKIANIEIYDLELETAVDSEDTSSVMSASSKPTDKFDDVIGAEDAKKELMFFVDYLKNPKKFRSKGLGMPKGVLFYGPPGTGKTLLAKAVAGESNVTFISMQANQFIKPYYGEGETAVRQLFATARKYAPTIIFIDEVDAFAQTRQGSGEDSQPERVLTTFLAEMDGFKTNPKKPVFVMAATNYGVEQGSEKCIDPAFVRRFDRCIYIDLPDKKARLQFIRKKIGDGKIFRLSEHEIENVAVRSIGMSLANLELVFGMAVRIAIRDDMDWVDDSIFEEAFETFNYGEKREWDSSELEKTAYHEAGHAFLCWYGGETPSYLTIVARGNFGGYMQHGDTEKIGAYSKKMLLNRIRTAMGGRASELVFFGAEAGLTTGASGDLANATAVAKSMVCSYGMDDDVGLAVVSNEELRSNAFAGVVRTAVNKILSQQLEQAKKILVDNKPAIDKIVEVLLEKNHLGAAEIDSIFSAYAKKEND